MADTERLLQLADRVESERPSRELDGEIAKAIGWTEVHGSALDPMLRCGCPPDHPYLEHVPLYTSIFGAARSLTGWLLTFASDIAADGLATVELSDTDPVRQVRGIAPTLETALCGAALRARALEGGDHG